MSDAGDEFAEGRAPNVPDTWLHATEQGRLVYARAGFVPSETDMELTW